MNPRLLFTIMRGYQLDERPSTIMGRIAKGYTTLELRELARYFAGLPWQDRRSSASAAAIAKGESLHLELCGRRNDYAPLRRHRPGPVHLQAAAGAHGWQDQCPQRTWAWGAIQDHPALPGLLADVFAHKASATPAPKAVALRSGADPGPRAAP
jgi:hypothetical protein